MIEQVGRSPTDTVRVHGLAEAQPPRETLNEIVYEPVPVPARTRTHDESGEYPTMVPLPVICHWYLVPLPPGFTAPQ